MEQKPSCVQGCTALYRGVQGCTALHSCTQLYKAVKAVHSCTHLYTPVHSCTTDFITQQPQHHSTPQRPVRTAHCSSTPVALRASASQRVNAAGLTRSRAPLDLTNTCLHPKRYFQPLIMAIACRWPSHYPAHCPDPLTASAPLLTCTVQTPRWRQTPVHHPAPAVLCSVPRTCKYPVTNQLTQRTTGTPVHISQLRMQ